MLTSRDDPRQLLLERGLVRFPTFSSPYKVTSFPIGHLFLGFSLFKKVPPSLYLHSELMDYYKDLKREDFASDDDYLVERVKRGLAAGFTFQQCRHHHLIELSLELGLSQADILAIVGPDTGYIFPNESAPTQSST